MPEVQDRTTTPLAVAQAAMDQIPDCLCWPLLRKDVYLMIQHSGKGLPQLA